MLTRLHPLHPRPGPPPASVLCSLAHGYGSELTTVLCLDDYHCHDREGRKKAKVTALAPEAQNFGALRRPAGGAEGI